MARAEQSGPSCIATAPHLDDNCATMRALGSWPPSQIVAPGTLFRGNAGEERNRESTAVRDVRRNQAFAAMQISSSAAGTMTRVNSIGFERRRWTPLVDRTLCPPQLLDGAVRRSRAMPAPPPTRAVFRTVQRPPEQR